MERPSVAGPRTHVHPRTAETLAERKRWRRRPSAVPCGTLNYGCTQFHTDVHAECASHADLCRVPLSVYIGVHPCFFLSSVAGRPWAFDIGGPWRPRPIHRRWPGEGVAQQPWGCSRPGFRPGVRVSTAKTTTHGHEGSHQPVEGPA